MRVDYKILLVFYYIYLIALNLSCAPMKFISQHDRRSIRLKDYDYAQAGEYFITICTHNRECILGDVKDGGMRLSQLGQVVCDTWYDLPNHNYGVELDAFVVMPNHIHGIIIINDITVGAGSESAPTGKR
ncbi:MAG: hypothetical protein JXA06_10605, partial [Bacteroidetes bacterium]|nr:hypothetical protein [Bacteroidota bacterium]